MARGVNQTMAWVVAVVFASTIFGVVLLITSHIAKKSEDRFKAGTIIEDPTDKLETPADTESDDGRTIKADSDDEVMEADDKENPQSSLDESTKEPKKKVAGNTLGLGGQLIGVRSRQIIFPVRLENFSHRWTLKMPSSLQI